MATTVESIQQLYVAYFNRPADAGGLAFWVDSVNKGVTLNSVAAQFAAQPEYKAVFAGMSPDSIVARVYQNLFNRLPELGGLNYWSNLLKAGTISVDRIVTEVAASAQQDPAKGPDTIAIQSKVAAAVSFTDYLNTDVAARVAYSTGGVNAVGVNYLSSVFDATTLGAAKTGLPTTTATAIITGNVAGGTTYTLALSPDTIVGTSGNDTINANSVNDGTGTFKSSLTDLDKIDGGAGLDTLNIVATDTIDTTLLSVSVSNVELVNLTSTKDVTANTTDWTGVTQVTANAVGAAAITAAATTNVAVNVTKAAAGAVAVDGGNNVVVTATGVDTGTIDIGALTAAKGTVTVVSSVAAGSSAIKGDAITIVGGTVVSVTANLAGKVNGTNTGDAIKVTGTADTTTVSVTQSAAATAAAKVAGVVDGAVTIADVNAGSATKAGTISTVSLTNYADSTISSNALTNLTLSGTAGKLGITSGLTKETVTTLNLTVSGLKESADNTITDVSNHFKTINVTATGKDSTITDLAASVATALTVAGDHVVDFASAAGLSALKTVTVTGAAGLTIDVSGITSVTGVDASATSGNNTVTVLADQTSFAGGSGVDTVVITKDATKAIDGGAGTADELVLNAVDTAFTSISDNAKITGFEVLGLGKAADGAYDASGFTALHIAAGVAADVEFTAVAAGAALTIDDVPGAVVTYSLKTQTSSDAASLTIANADADGLDFSGKAIVLTGIEAVTLNSLGSDEAGGGVNKVAITDATATSLTITGTEGIVLHGFGGATLKTIDASAFGADFTVDLTDITLATAGVSFKGGDANITFVDTNLAAGKVLTYTAGNGDNDITLSSATTGSAKITLGDGDNTVTLTGSTGASTVTAGLGENHIVLGGGATVVTLGVDTDDADVVTIAVPATANNYASITGLSTDDVLQFTAVGAEIWSGVAGTAASAQIKLDASTALFADYVTAASAVGDGTDGAFSWFQFGGNTYVVEDNKADAGFQAGSDIIVKLTGTVDLSKAVLDNTTHTITLA